MEAVGGIPMESGESLRAQALMVSASYTCHSRFPLVLIVLCALEKADLGGPSQLSPLSTSGDGR